MAEKLQAKLQITGDIDVLTGLHIGGGNAFVAIGAIDSPVVVDSISRKPLIPGSSLKGKIRSLLAKTLNDKVTEQADGDNEVILRLFGSSKKGNIKTGRLIFSDMILKNAKELYNKGLNSLTEVKFENRISRSTSVADPRQIERVVRGSKFDLDIVYDLTIEEDVIEDMNTFVTGIKLLQYDYLGGGGTRGNGKVKFSNLQADVVTGEIPEQLLNDINNILSKI